MEKHLLKEIIEKKEKKVEFAIVTNMENGESCLFEKNKPISKNFEKHKEKINFHFDKKKNCIIEGTNILKARSIQTAQLDAEILMAKALGTNRDYVILNNNKNLEDKNLIAFQISFSDRRSRGPADSVYWMSVCLFLCLPRLR